MIRGLHHVGIVTTDIDKAKRFYCEVFGFEVYSESEWHADNAMFNTIIAMERSATRICMLKGPNAYIELFEYLEPVSTVDPRKLQPSDRGIRHPLRYNFTYALQ